MAMLIYWIKRVIDNQYHLIPHLLLKIRFQFNIPDYLKRIVWRYSDFCPGDSHETWYVMPLNEQLNVHLLIEPHMLVDIYESSKTPWFIIH